MREFLGIEDFSLRDANRSSGQEYAPLMEAFKRKPLPMHYVESMYNSKCARTFYLPEERDRFTLDWTRPEVRANRQGPGQLNRDPIIVYQMGKVGSMTVEVSLRKAYADLEADVPIHRVHLMNLAYEDAVRILAPDYPDPEKTLGAIRNGLEMRQVVDQRPDQAWRLISLVREPIARNIATFFQSLEEFIPDWKQMHRRGELDAKYLQRMFLEKNSLHKGPLEWFDNELNAVFGIDVYGTPFPHAAGYKIYRERPRTPLLVIRLEDLNRCAAMAMGEFLGLRSFALQNVNIGEEKEYADLYRALRAEPLPLQYVEAMYSSKYARHFYGSEELRMFRNTWLGHLD